MYMQKLITTFSTKPHKEKILMKVNSSRNNMLFFPRQDDFVQVSENHKTTYLFIVSKDKKFG